MIKSFILRWLSVLLWATVIFVVSDASNPYRALPSRWESLYELLGCFLHVGEFAIFAVLMAWALIWRGELRLVQPCIVFGLSSAYALFDETHQLFVPGRAFQTLDLVLDLVGAAIGLSLYLFWHTSGRRWI